MAITDSDLDLAQYIDHSLLIPTATSEQLEAYCQQADQYHFPTVCVYPAAVKQAVQLLHGKKTLVSTVIGFPAGATTSAVKRYEALEAAEICMDAGVSYLKTSTGWFGGATVSDVKFLKEISKGRVGIKASGGIRTLEQALALIQAGATRLGTSRGVDLVRQQKAAFEE